MKTRILIALGARFWEESRQFRARLQADENYEVTAVDTFTMLRDKVEAGSFDMIIIEATENNAYAKAVVGDLALYGLLERTFPLVSTQEEVGSVHEAGYQQALIWEMDSFWDMIDIMSCQIIRRAQLTVGLLTENAELRFLIRQGLTNLRNHTIVELDGHTDNPNWNQKATHLDLVLVDGIGSGFSQNVVLQKQVREKIQPDCLVLTLVSEESQSEGVLPLSGLWQLIDTAAQEKASAEE